MSRQNNQLFVATGCVPYVLRMMRHFLCYSLYNKKDQYYAFRELSSCPNPFIECFVNCNVPFLESTFCRNQHFVESTIIGSTNKFPPFFIKN